MNKFKIFGKEYSRTQIKNNIMRVFELSQVGFEWYQLAHHLAVELSLDSQYTIAQTSGIIASLSPQKSWSENKKLARAFILHGVRKGHVGAMINKAVRISETTDRFEIASILNGQKIVSFYWNILNPMETNHVTIDRHAIGIALNGSNRKPLPSLQITAKQYKFIAECYKYTAEKLDVIPAELQAVTWVTYRELN